MKRIRLHDDEPSVGGIAAGVALGALAGFVVGVVVAQRVGGLSGITSRLRRGMDTLVHRGQQGIESLAGAERGEEDDEYDEDEYDVDDELDERALDGDSALEERVLRAFRRDAILSERAIDIGAIGEGIIELSGWVETRDEAEHATAVTRTVPGIVTVVSRLFVGSDEQESSDLDEDDLDDDGAPLPGGRWGGQGVGMGRRRQGNSGEMDRHADPKPVLENKWLDEEHALEEAAGPVEGIAERRGRKKKSDKPASAEGGESEVPSPS